MLGLYLSLWDLHRHSSEADRPTSLLILERLAYRLDLGFTPPEARDWVRAHQRVLKALETMLSPPSPSPRVTVPPSRFEREPPV
jgi:hypothetical protein